MLTVVKGAAVRTLDQRMDTSRNFAAIPGNFRHSGASFRDCCGRRGGHGRRRDGRGVAAAGRVGCGGREGCGGGVRGDLRGRVRFSWRHSSIMPV